MIREVTAPPFHRKEICLTYDRNVTSHERRITNCAKRQANSYVHQCFLLDLVLNHPLLYKGAHLDDLLACKICFMPMHSAYTYVWHTAHGSLTHEMRIYRLIECGHTFCKACLDQLDRRVNPLCAICRGVTQKTPCRTFAVEEFVQAGGLWAYRNEE